MDWEQREQARLRAVLPWLAGCLRLVELSVTVDKPTLAHLLRTE